MSFLDKLSFLASTSKEKLRPVLSVARKALNTFIQHQLTPLLASIVRQIENFGVKTLLPRIQKMGDYVRNNAELAMQTFGFYGKMYARMAGQIIVRYAKANPGKTALLTPLGWTIICPYVMIRAFGIGGLGPRSRELLLQAFESPGYEKPRRSYASSYQRSSGRIARGSVYATAQSAGTKGKRGKKAVTISQIAIFGVMVVIILW
ncbi:uncharacterized protein RSE6_02177 [Rhynchosporium secalis]|uniref:Uncharacterized protein n=1 Tax=Rhynchosporium secalis TaxID=38038 RepID=A0A1E1LZM0_RHYSE|nr:uncharacterized protein RSE6_02177 [Rhynchosporium secalis]